MNRETAMIINGVLGDIYGSPLEMMPMEYIHKVYGTEITDYIVTDKVYERQFTYTDDSEMTLAVLDIVNQYKNGIELTKEIILSTYIKYFEPTRGYSGNVYRMFCNYIIDKKTINERDTNSNGSLMRISPLILIDFKNDEELKKLIKLIHYPTHMNEDAFNTSLDIIKYVSNNYAGNKLKQKLEFILNNNDSDEFEGVDELIGLDGIVSEETLSVALWGVLKNINMPSRILGKVLAYGGDSDTIGSIAGQITGLMFGETVINKEWLKHIENKDKFISLIGI
jgi:ADP-ribosylglycohydrolase